MKKKLLKSLRMLLVAAGLCMGANVNAQTVTATLSGLTGSGKTIYPVYTLSATDDGDNPVASPVFEVSGTSASAAAVSGTTLTFSAATAEAITITETTTGATTTLSCVGPYERTTYHNFIFTDRSQIPTGYSGSSWSNTTPRGFSDSNITRHRFGFAGGAGDNTFAQYYQNIALSGAKGGTVQMDNFQGYGLQANNKDLYMTLLASFNGQIVKLSYLQGNSETPITLASAKSKADYTMMTGGNYQITISTSDDRLITGLEVYTPTSLTAVPSSFDYTDFGNTRDVTLTGIVLTKDNISGIAGVISSKYTSRHGIAISAQTADDITVEDLNSLIPDSKRNTWFIDLPKQNINNRSISWFKYKTGANIRSYNSYGGNKWDGYSVALIDGENYGVEFGVTATVGASYNRSFTADIVNTICLPFAIDNTSGALGKIYTLDDTQSSGSAVAFKTVTTTEANKPYLFVPSTTGMLEIAANTVFSAKNAQTTTVGDFSLIGVQSSTSINSDESNSVYAFKTDGTLIKVTSATTLKGFRAYLVATGESKARQLTILFGDETTGISKVDNERDAVSGYYNLNGQRVSQPTGGLYIFNGKKVIVK